MTEPIRTMLAQTFSLSTSYAIAVVDSFSTRTVTINPTGTVWYRNWIAKQTTGAGATESDAADFIKHVQARLNLAPGSTLWTLALQSSGVIRATYSGTGTGSLTWTSTVPRNLLGFNATVSLAANASVNATYAPTHVAYILCLANDSSWVSQPQTFAGGVLPSGEVYGWGNATFMESRTFDIRLSPTDATEKATAGTSITEMFPLYSRRKTPSSTPGTAPPWSVHELLRTSYSDGTNCGRLGAIFNTFTASPSVTDTFDEVFLAPETITARDAIRPSVPTWTARSDWERIRVYRVANALILG